MLAQPIGVSSQVEKTSSRGFPSSPSARELETHSFPPMINDQSVTKLLDESLVIDMQPAISRDRLHASNTKGSLIKDISISASKNTIVNMTTQASSNALTD